VTSPFAMARARRALEQAGLDATVPLERAESVTNEVWVSDDYVVRVNRHPNQRLKREAFLGPLLPHDIGYPGVVSYGGDVGADTLITTRCRGTTLTVAWPTMDRAERRRAIAQLATIVRRLHEFPAPDGLPPIAVPQLLSPDTLRAVDPLIAGLEQAAAMTHVDPGLIADLGVLVAADAPVIEPFRSPTLIHGDLHFQNVLWDGYVITALLDFEFARAAPPDLDLDVFLRFCAYPKMHVADQYVEATRDEDFAEIPWWFAEEYPELFDHPSIFERLRLYCIAYNVRDLLETPMQGPSRAVGPFHPHRRLEAIVRGTSHIDRYAGRIAGFGTTSAQSLAAVGPPDGRPDQLPPLSPGAMASRLAAAGDSTLPLARRTAAAPTQPTASSEPGPVRGIAYEAIDGELVVRGANGQEQWRGKVAGGSVVTVVAVDGSDNAVVLLDWRRGTLPEGIGDWDVFDNVVAIQPTGAERWRPDVPSGDRCFTSLRFEDGRLEAESSSEVQVIDPATGAVVEHRYLR